MPKLGASPPDPPHQGIQSYVLIATSIYAHWQFGENDRVTHWEPKLGEKDSVTNCKPTILRIGDLEFCRSVILRTSKFMTKIGTNSMSH